VNQNEAFLLSNPEAREKFRKRFEITKSLCYKGQQAFDDVLKRVKEFVREM
jgi:hypothetical protein